MKAFASHNSRQHRPLVSVIMANFNGAAHLADAIGSVQRQSLREFELIVCDDASTDDSVGIVAGLKAQDPRIRLLQNDHNFGPGAARNRAIDAAGGQWIAVVDSDDRIHPERLSTLVAAATQDRSDLVADDLLEFFPNSRPSRRLLRGELARAPFWVDVADYVRLNHFYGRGPALGYLKPLIRSSVLKELAIRYDETLRIAEDYNLVLRLLSWGKAMRIYPIPLYYYRKHSNSISHRLNTNALASLKIADLRFLAQIPDEKLRLRNAVEARIKSIDIALAYEQLLTALKERRWRDAFAAILTEPRAAALLRLPAGVRLHRLRQQFKVRLRGGIGVPVSTPDGPSELDHRQDVRAFPKA